MKINILYALFAAALLAGEGEQQVAQIGDLKLTSGEVIRDCRIGYRTYGTLNAARSNAIVFPTWFSGRTENLAAYAGPGKLIDTSRFFLITIDALGNGISSSPSNGGSGHITIRDMVNSQHRLLTGHLGIQHVHAVVGISMGGMQTFEWITAYPEFMDRAVPIIGSPKLASPDLLLWGAQLAVIEQASRCSCDKREAMKAVMNIHQFALQTPEYRAQQTPPTEFAKFKASFEAGAGERITADDWASQLRAMMSTNAGPTSSVKAKTLVVVATQDHMVNPLPALDFAKAMNAQTLLLESNCGHLAIGCEAAKLNKAVAAFLE